jgi:nucleotide-binding universal stress UspA family protein
VSGVILIVVGVVCLGIGLAGGYWLPPHGRRPGKDRPKPVRRILLPFTGSSISRRAFDAAVRLATAENATIVPAFLARVPRYLPIESAVPAQCSDGMVLLEAIEQKAEAQGLAVDARVGRGRSYRDALRRLLAEEHFDRVIVSATDSPRIGLSSEDLEWLLERVPAEVMILRPAPDDKREISVAASVNGHF